MNLKLLPQVIHADEIIPERERTPPRQKYLESLLRENKDLIYRDARKKVFEKFKVGIGTKNFYRTRAEIRGETASRRGKDAPPLSAWWRNHVAPLLEEKGIRAISWRAGGAVEVEVVQKVTL